jgi:hypothetical protein
LQESHISMEGKCARPCSATVRAFLFAS